MKWEEMRESYAADIAVLTQLSWLSEAKIRIKRKTWRQTRGKDTKEIEWDKGIGEKKKQWQYNG